MADSADTAKSAQKKVGRSSAKKKKPSAESSSLPKPVPTPCIVTKSKSQSKKAWPQLYPPISKSVVVVESVTKAKVIQGYLGEMYEVLPSYGHIRDLAARSGSVRPDDDFSMVWEVPSPAWSHLKRIKVALSGYVALNSPPLKKKEKGKGKL